MKLHLTNCPEFLLFWFATARIDAVMMPTNLLSTPDELSYPVHQSESVPSVTQPGLLPAVQAIRGRCSNLRQIILTGSEPAPEWTRLDSPFIEGQPDELAETTLDPLDETAFELISGDRGGHGDWAWS